MGDILNKIIYFKAQMSNKEQILIEENPSNYWEQLERLDRLIRAAELKAGLIFSFHSLFLGIVIEKASEVTKFMDGSLSHSLLIIPWFLLVAVSLYFALSCFRPKLEMSFDTNAFFFMDANRHYGDEKQFSKAFREINQDPDELYGQLAEQIYVHCKITDHKFGTVQRSLKFLSYSFFWLIFLVFILLLNF